MRMKSLEIEIMKCRCSLANRQMRLRSVRILKKLARNELKNLKMIVDERQTSVATEYFCIFEDDATEWLEVPDDNEKRQ